MKSHFYVFWTQFLSIVSIIQSLLYSILIGFDLKPEDPHYEFFIVFIIFTELCYCFDLIVESLKAYDISGQMIYEMRWQKTMKRFWSHTSSKFKVFNLVPWGALG